MDHLVVRAALCADLAVEEAEALVEGRRQGIQAVLRAATLIATATRPRSSASVIARRSPSAGERC